MKRQPLVSIIVPVYKVEKYLTRCIDSILEQTIEDYELILVDDGSPDKSGSICDEYAKREGRISVIHKENGGVSSARNAGIEVSKGEWLCFVDSDDYLINSYLEDFHVKVKSNVDLYLQGYRTICALSDQEEIHSFISEEGSDIMDVFAEAENKYIMNSPCFKLYKSEIVINNKIRFDTRISYGEDHLFSLNYFLNVNTVSKSLSTGYINMRNGNESLTQRLVPFREMMIYIMESHSLQERILKKNVKGSKVATNAVNKRFVKNIKKALFDVVSIKGVESKDEVAILKAYIKKNKKFAGVSFKEKLFVSILLFAPIDIIIVLAKLWLRK